MSIHVSIFVLKAEMKRNHFQTQITKASQIHPVVAILGPRQCGKTTLARFYAESLDRVHYFDLEDPRDIARLETPMLTLEDLSGLIVIDEIQRVHDLFPVLRVLVDQQDKNRQFLILGSASRDLIQQSSESLAGRITHLELTPLRNFHWPPKFGQSDLKSISIQMNEILLFIKICKAAVAIAFQEFEVL